MSMPSKLKHLTYITDFIRNQPGIPKAALLQKLVDYNQATTLRTLERDVRLLRELYEVDIEFNLQLNGYFIHEENNPNLRTFEHFAKSQVLGGMLADMLSNGVKVWDVVDIEDQVPIMNLENVKILVEAILEKQRVKISYLKFFQKETDTYILEPHLIRQVIKRWYLLAGDTATEPATIKTFGLERVIKIEKLDSTFTPLTKELRKRSRKVYGISQSNEDRQIVLLETNRWQGKYFETLPIHHSQRVEYVSNDLCRISLNVVINQELFQMIVSQPHPIKVLKPDHFKSEFRVYLEKKLENLD